MARDEDRGEPRHDRPEMDCGHVEPLLSSYLLDELGPPDRSQVDSHLGGCAKCREELDLLRATAEALAKSPPPGDVPAGVEREPLLLRARVLYQRPTRLWWAVTAAAALVVLGTGLVIYRVEQRNRALVEEQQLALRRVEVETRNRLPAEEEQTSESARQRGAAVEGLVERESLVREAKGPAPAAPAQRQADGSLADAPSWPLLSPAAEPTAPAANETYGLRQQADRAALVPRSLFVTPEGAAAAAGGAVPAAGGAGAARGGAEAARLGGAMAGGTGMAGSTGAVPRAPGALPPVEVRLSARTALDDGAAKFGGEAKPGAAPAKGLADLAGRNPETRDRRRSVAGLPTDPRSATGADGLGTDSFNKELGVNQEARWKRRVDDIFTQLDRQPGETPEMMFFRYWGTNPFQEAAVQPLSTFSVDVDTASYTIFRSYLYRSGVLPPREAIRTEEFVNYFKADYPPPPPPQKPGSEGDAFTINIELAPNPFARDEEHRLLRVGLKGREVKAGQRRACGLVFVIDTSGSMRRENRLGLVKEGLRLLVNELDEGDSVGIVAFDREARTVLDPAPASEKERILAAINALEPRQNTNVAAGLERGYQLADQHRIRGGSNRVILLSDGVANTGMTDSQTMLESVRKEREKGIYLTCVGVGMGNLNDALLEDLADKGDGQCVYVDRAEEAHRVFVENLSGTLEPIARNVKVQVDFDPARVIRYRLLGYEKRDLPAAAFRDNSTKAALVGAGHAVTVFYDFKAKNPVEGKIATVRLRLQTIEHGEAQEMTRDILLSENRGSFTEASPRFQLGACVAQAAEVLRDSYWARGVNLGQVLSRLTTVAPLLKDDKDVPELVALLTRADALLRARQATEDEVARNRTLDTLKDNLYLRASIEDELKASAASQEADAAARERQRRLEEIRRQNEELRRQLEELIVK